MDPKLVLLITAAGAALSLYVFVTAFSSVNHWDSWAAEAHRVRHGQPFNIAEDYSQSLYALSFFSAAAALAWAVALEFLARRWLPTKQFAGPLALVCGIAVALAVAAWSVAVDNRHGEGVVILSWCLFFGPMLGIGFFFIRKGVLRLRTTGAVVGVLLGFVVLLFFLQGVFGPSETGGPNILVVPLGVAFVFAAWGFSRWVARRVPLRQFNNA